MKSHQVMEDMGEVALSFAWVSTDRKHFKWVNSQGKQQRCYKTWNEATKVMPDGVNYFGLVTKTHEAKSKSGATFEIVGVLCCFDNMQDAMSVNQQYWGKSKWIEDADEKKAWTKEFAAAMNYHFTQHAPGDFSSVTYSKLLEIV